MKRYTITVETSDEFDVIIDRLGTRYGMNGATKLKEMMHKSMVVLLGVKNIVSCDIKYKSVKRGEA